MYRHNKIEPQITIHKCKSPKAYVFLLPCVGGDTSAYEIPVNDFLSRGYSIIEFNPRLLGVKGAMVPLRVTMKDLYYFIAKEKLNKEKLIMIAHSGHCNVILSLDDNILNIEKYFIMQPALDIRASILFMYNKKNMLSFMRLAYLWVTKKRALREILSNDSWLDFNYWHDNDLRNKINQISEDVLINLGDLFEEFYIHGHNYYGDFEKYRKKIHLIVSRQDIWVNGESILNLSKKYKVPTKIIESSKDHYFTGVLNEVWDYILESLDQNI